MKEKTKKKNLSKIWLIILPNKIKKYIKYIIYIKYKPEKIGE